MSSELEGKNSKQPRAKDTEPKKSWGEVNFVPCELDAETKEIVKAKKVTPNDLLSQFQAFLDSGYKVSLAYEKRNDCIGAYATMPDANHPAHGKCLSARGPDAESALKVLLYKHYVMLDGSWMTAVDRTFEPDTWG